MAPYSDNGLTKRLGSDKERVVAVVGRTHCAAGRNRLAATSILANDPDLETEVTLICWALGNITLSLSLRSARGRLPCSTLDYVSSDTDVIAPGVI